VEDSLNRTEEWGPLEEATACISATYATCSASIPPSPIPATCAWHIRDALLDGSIADPFDSFEGREGLVDELIELVEEKASSSVRECVTDDSIGEEGEEGEWCARQREGERSTSSDSTRMSTISAMPINNRIAVKGGAVDRTAVVNGLTGGDGGSSSGADVGPEVVRLRPDLERARTSSSTSVDQSTLVNVRSATGGIISRTGRRC
jgi:hypothetical protein